VLLLPLVADNRPGARQVQGWLTGGRVVQTGVCVVTDPLIGKFVVELGLPSSLKLSHEGAPVTESVRCCHGSVSCRTRSGPCAAVLYITCIANGRTSHCVTACPCIVCMVDSN
jgi:hypothetical protein